jgi:hypothetical protein
VRFVRHLIGALVLLIVLLIGVVAFVLYDPLASSRKFLSMSEMIVSPSANTDRGLVGGEKPIQQTDPAAMAALALHYQPTLVVSAYDRNWPVSMLSMLGTRWDNHGVCLYVGGRCKVRDPTAAALDPPGASSDYLQFPTPVDNVIDTFRSAASALGLPVGPVTKFPRELTDLNPFASAQMYFYYLARTTRESYRGLPAGLISLEYWFYYPLNYFPLVRIPLEALSNPIGSTIGNTDYHQGDLEHVAVLLDPKTMKPLYLYMARHAGEGQAYKWGSKSIEWVGDHATVYAALGSHASYASCGIQRRSRTYWFINDYVVCIAHKTFAFVYSSTPLVDLAKTSWGCWRGHLGKAGRHLHGGNFGFAPYETPGPLSPLMQQENFNVACQVPKGTPKPPAPL